MFGEIGSFIKRLFVKPEEQGGGINLWGVLPIVGGLIAGGSGFLGEGGLLLGAGLGFGIAALKEAFLPGTGGSPEASEEPKPQTDGKSREKEQGSGTLNPNAKLPSMAPRPGVSPPRP